MTKMSGERDFESVVTETADYAGKEAVTPEQYRDLKAAVFGAEFGALAFSDRSYFVIGSYDDGERYPLDGTGERYRLELVRDQLRARDAAYAFTMDDFPEAWEYWTAKFKVLASRSDHVVGVFEHSHGGHAWESGYIDHEEHRRKSHVLKREYASEETERKAFDAMFAHFLETMAEQGRLYPWSDETELLEQVENVP